MKPTKLFKLVVLLMPLVWSGLDLTAGSAISQLSWIPRDATFLMVLDRPAQNQELHAKFGAVIVFAAGVDGVVQQFSEITGQDLLRDAERLIVAKVPVKGQRQATVAIAQVSAVKNIMTPVPKGEFRLETLDEKNLVFGNATAVERVITLHRTSGDQSLLQSTESANLIRGFVASAQEWGIASPDWLGFQFTESELATADVGGRSVCRGLLGIRSIAFSAEISKDTVRFVIRTDLREEGDAVILADGLREELASLRLDGKNSAPSEVQQLLTEAKVRIVYSFVELEMSLSGPALESVRLKESAKALLQWQLPDPEREKTQNIREILDLLDLSGGSRVADVGSGMGFFTVRLARTVGSTGRVYAVDIQPDRVELLRWRIQNAPLPQVEVLLGQPDDPRLPAGQLDAVLIVNSYHEMPQHMKMLEHIRAALKPGGRLLITEPWSAERRNESRESQEKSHLIAPVLVEQDLREQGFEIVVRNDDFIVHSDSDRRDSLILGRRR